jgi:hypothetical protein
VTQVIVIIAALLYIGDKLMEALSKSASRMIKQRLDALNALHDEARTEIESSFELWWEDGQKQKARSATLQKMTAQLPSEIPTEFVEQMVGPMIDLSLEGLESAAMHLAIHAHMGNKEKELMAKLPKIGNFQQEVVKQREEHERDLDRIRGELLDHGLDPMDLEQHFVTA